MLSSLRKMLGGIGRIEQQIKYVREALGRIESRQVATLEPSQIAAAEFRVFSQWGEDGILQHLLRYVPVPRKLFVEFGVENYTESNTRFLLINDQWAGLVLDGSEQNIGYIRRDDIYWRYSLKAVQAFITRENINDLIRSNGISGNIGILSVDIDGNDYWVWEAIDAVDPAIVVVEYNARFGPERSVTIPYQANFRRSPDKGGSMYYGASLSALTALGKKKGYALAGCNSAGNNAFFVKRDLKPASIPELSPTDAFVRNQFRESRGIDGDLTFLSQLEEEELLRGLPFVEVGQP